MHGRLRPIVQWHLHDAEDDRMPTRNGNPAIGAHHKMTIHQEDYTVRIDAFQGPLDLLLYLIRRAEVDITDIPVAEITKQYLDFLNDVELIDIDEAGEFLVMAATLMEIKSRMLMPPENNAGDANGDRNADVDPTAGLDQADPRYELVRQLLEYKRFRDAAHDLDERRIEWQQRFPLTAAKVIRPPVANDPAGKNLETDDSDDDDPESDRESRENNMEPTDIEDVSVWDLAQIFQRIIAAIDFARMGDHHVEFDDTPIELHEEDLLDQIRNSTLGRVSLRAAFQGRTRVEAIGLFLAALELVRQRRVLVLQDRMNDDIVVLAQPDDAELPADEVDDSENTKRSETGAESSERSAKQH